jgi:hypothetical protein
MPNLDRRTFLNLTRAQRKYNDTLARQQAERRLDELDAALDRERQRRGLKPITCDNGTIVAWVRTRPQSPGER